MRNFRLPEKKYEKLVYEYNRSASSALSEFAPSNSFYVDGRKLTIDQVDLTTAQSALGVCVQTALMRSLKQLAGTQQPVLNAEAPLGPIPVRCATC